MNFSTKAQTLKNLKQIGINVPKLKIFKVNDYIKNKKVIINNIKNSFSGKVALRSSSAKEDLFKKTNAGKYKSFLNIETKNLAQIENTIDQIISDFDKNFKNEFFVQEMVKNVKMSGVCTTRDIHSKLPYFVVNYSKGKDTTSVTSGKANTMTFNYLENKYFKINDKNKNKIISISNKLIKIFNNDSLDIEFAINKKNQLFILQVRPIYFKNERKKISRANLNNILIKLKKKINKLKKKQYDLFGNTTYFGVMPDWNPAEIIGIKPKPLALSLYKEIITDHIWSSNRKSIGFKDLSSHHLMTTFFGTPFIDVRIDFNSWIPSKLNPYLTEKLMKFYLYKFKNNKDFHDKIEFEILYTCYTLSTKKKIFTELVNRGFSRYEINEILKNLRTINLNCIKQYNTNHELIKKLIKKQIQISKSKIHEINKIYFLIEDCKKYGTFAFCGIARCAFIAVEMLNSFVNEKIISEKEKSSFLNSIETVNKKMQLDINKLSKSNFIKKYGHLRPDTYEISNLNYKDGYKNYFQNVKKFRSLKKKEPFKLNFKQIEKINKKLKLNKLQINAKQLLKFIKDSIELREYSKFIFSKNIDMVFGYLKNFGKKYSIRTNDLSFLEISKILNLHYNLDVGETIKYLKQEISNNRKIYNINSKISLPDIITDEKSIYLFNSTKTKINYVTNNLTSGKLFTYNKNLNYKKIEHKILCIENADPGYDFVFNFNIKGLITRFGGANSHMAIRCAELNIPALIGVGEKNYQNIIDSNYIEIDCKSKKFNLI